MRHQRKGYWCGIASIANALEVLGIKRSQREIAKLCDAVDCNDAEDDDDEESGANETEMKRALLANGCRVDEACFHKGQETETYCWLYDHVARLGPVILCVDDDDHWVTAVGMCGPQMLLFDPSRNCGVEVHSWPSLAARWVNSDGIYYGIGVSK